MVSPWCFRGVHGDAVDLPWCLRWRSMDPREFVVVPWRFRGAFTVSLSGRASMRLG